MVYNKNVGYNFSFKLDEAFYKLWASVIAIGAAPSALLEGRNRRSF